MMTSSLTLGWICKRFPKRFLWPTLVTSCVFAGVLVGPLSLASESSAPAPEVLPVVNRVNDHPLLDSSGKRVNLLDLKKGKIAVAGLIYTSCPEAIGCPMTMATLQHLDRLLAERPQLAKRIVLFLISFDPERDTPEHMATLRASLSPRSEWYFLTSASEAELKPLLEDFDQPVAKISDEKGVWSGRFHHVFKIFLLDEDNNIRNVYPMGFVGPQVILGDIEVLAKENAR
jgi:cytochrome c peroxidase